MTGARVPSRVMAVGLAGTAVAGASHQGAEKSVFSDAGCEGPGRIQAKAFISWRKELLPQTRPESRRKRPSRTPR